MDIATFLGILSAFGILAFAIITRGEFSMFFDLNSLLLVLGGTFGAILINYPMKDLVRVMRIVKNAFVHKENDYISIIPDMVRYSKYARKDGVLSLEKILDEVDDQFFYEGLRLIVDGAKPEVVNEVLRNEIDFLATRHRVGISIFKAMGQYALAFGIIGTLIALIPILRSLNDVNQIASSIALALITTFYGTVLANTLFLPIAGKLKECSEAETLRKEMILAGILSIQAGEVPGMIEQRMVSFLPTTQRRVYMKENTA